MISGEKDVNQKTIDEIKLRHPQPGQELIQKAFDCACTAHRGQIRLSGNPYIYHAVEVARILNELEMDFVSISAGLLHDVIEDTLMTIEDLKKEFPEPIPLLVEGVTKISEITLQPARERYIENIRKMLLAMAQDVRVIIIKLSDRLHNMRTLQYLPQEKQMKIARDTLEIYAPLAHRLGIIRIRCELEDLAMKYLYPEEFRRISRVVEDKRDEREKFLGDAIHYLKVHLGESDIKPEITGRTKNIFSIYRKMRRQGITLGDVYDLIALRVIVDTEEQCWRVLGRIHAIWRPIPDRFKDYISNPKDNMYRSIHTTVVGPEGHRIEIQVRTWEMHRIAETGVAAHWKYKEGVKRKTDIEEKLQWLRQLTEWIKDVHDPGDFMTALREEVFADTIFCFTPDGDVIDLPADATPLDFAYRIHTEVGNRCIGAKVNNRMIALKQSLKNGDIVRILTTKNAHPTPDWLDIVRTPTAKAKIRRYLRSQQYSQKVEEGKDLLLREIKQRGFDLKIEEIAGKLRRHMTKLNVRDMEHLFAEIGFGTLSIHAILNHLQIEKGEETAKTKPTTHRKRPPGIILEGVGHDRDIAIRLARCCSPIAGEKIVAFVTVKSGITVHRKDCPNLQRIIEEVSNDSPRLIPARWSEGGMTIQHVGLRVTAWDRKGLLKDITGAISNMNLDILATSTKSHTRKKYAVLNLLLAIENRDQYNQLIANLKGVAGLISLQRVNRQHW